MYEQYIRASSIETALQAMQEAPRSIHILAGGPDLLLQKQFGKDSTFKSLVDISNVEILST